MGRNEDEKSSAKPKKQDKEDTAEMSDNEIESRDKNKPGDFKNETVGTGDFETEKIRAKPKKLDMEGTASNENKASNFTIEPIDTGDSGIETSGASDLHQD